MNIYTDGSVLTNEQAGAGFVIPQFKTENNFFLGKGRSIFTAEIIALVMALLYRDNLPMALFNILFCVDSLNSTDSKIRSDNCYSK